MKKSEKEENQALRLLFNHINMTLPKHVLPADEVSDILNISTDAAYRRIRGHKKLNIDEISTLCKHFNLSFDALFNLQSNYVSFKYLPLQIDNLDNFQGYMEMLAGGMRVHESTKEKKMLLLAADIPLVHLVEPNDLAIFKVFTRANSIFNYKGNFSSFCKQVKSSKFTKCCNEITQYYNLIPSEEVWNTCSFDSILSLIDYYNETGFFESKETPLNLCAQLLGLVAKLRVQTENGQKCSAGKKTDFKFYISEVALGNNFLLINNDNRKVCYLKLFSANGIITYNPVFCDDTEKWIRNIFRKSVLISGTSQKERHFFFKTLEQKVKSLIDKIGG